MRSRRTGHGRGRRSSRSPVGVNAETLRNWIRAADGRHPGSHTTPRASGPAEPTSLEAENATLRGESAELRQEQEILRRAAKYFAGEANW